MNMSEDEHDAEEVEDEEDFDIHDRFIPDFVLPAGGAMDGAQGVAHPLVDRARNRRLPWPRPHPNNLVPLRDDVEYEEITIDSDAVTTFNMCETVKAQKLCILDVAHKLKLPGTYDIGGTYSNKPDYWFLYKTALCPGKTSLLSLFVCQRMPGQFTVGVSNSNAMSHRKSSGNMGKSILAKELAWYTFKNEIKDEVFYIKTFCFSEDDVKALENQILYIELRIHENVPSTLLPDVVKRIKLQHDFGQLLYNSEKTDFILISSSSREFPTHKIMLVAHSPVLREIIKLTSKSSLALDVNDEELELLLEFMYTGTIKEMRKQDCTKLLTLAQKYELRNMFLLMQHAISEQISVENAIEVAEIAEKYNLQKLEENVFNFIKDHMEVLKSDGWKNLENVALTKKLLAYLMFHNNN